MSGAKLARDLGRLNSGFLVLMTDDERLPDPVAAARRLPKGSMVILRARDAARRHALADALRAETSGLILLVSDDPVLADCLHGLHLPEKRAREAAHWRALRPHWVITVAAHSDSGLRIAHADAALLSPIFATKSHPHTPPLTAARARLMARNSLLPVLALGGVTARNVPLLKGFAGFAAIGALT
ncbi:MAG TPA: thiamine phosphate synthase [Rhizomicrobium sp.]|jgi:thiamine-phosphate pyrophosphorylase|nr:thiamine phosphate synthase [Rhizomicrobium sp.]